VFANISNSGATTGGRSLPDELVAIRLSAGKKSWHIDPFWPIVLDEGAALDGTHDVRFKAQPMLRPSASPIRLRRRPKAIGERSFVDRYPHSASVSGVYIERQ
jgi:hypothetical protein